MPVLDKLQRMISDLEIKLRITGISVPLIIRVIDIKNRSVSRGLKRSALLYQLVIFRLCRTVKRQAEEKTIKAIHGFMTTPFGKSPELFRHDNYRKLPGKT